jgi:hypothetical protein
MSFVFVSKTARSFFASGPAHYREFPGDFRFHCPWCRILHLRGASYDTVLANWANCTGRSPLLDMGYVLHFGGMVAYGAFPRLGASDFILLSNKLRRGMADPDKSGRAS